MLGFPRRCGQAAHCAGPVLAAPTPARTHLAKGNTWKDRGVHLAFTFTDSRHGRNDGRECKKVRRWRRVRWF